VAGAATSEVGVIVLCALIVGSAVCASADTNEAVGLPEAVTLDYCLTRSLAAAEQRGLFAAELAVARADVAAARARSNPHLNLTPDARYYMEGSGIDGALSADLGEAFLEIPQNRLHREIARRNVTRARVQQDGLRIHRAAEVMRAYTDCLKSAGELDLARKEASAAEAADTAWNGIRMDPTAMSAGREAARLALQDARAKSAQAELLARESRRQLSKLCDFPPGYELRAVDLPQFEMPPVALEDCLAWAAANHSGLRSALHERDTTDLMARLARMGRLPTPGLAFGYTDRGRDEFDEEDSGPYGSVQLRIPLWDAGETRANVERLEARRSALDVETAKLETELSKTIASTYAAMQEAFAAMQSLRADAQPEREFKSARIRHRSGELSPIAWEAAQLSRARHETLLRMKNWDCYRAQASLMEAVEASREELRAGLKSGGTGAVEE
jgi:outer membrane protein TolC